MQNNVTEIKQLEDLDKLIDSSLAHLKKDRDRDILIKRHGINVAKTQTLEQIGGELGITRERVRQIEKAALTRIQKEQNFNSQLSQNTAKILVEAGGIMAFTNLAEVLKVNPSNQAKLSFLIKLNPSFNLVDRNDNHSTIVLLDDIYKPNEVLVLHQALIDTIKSAGQPVVFDQITSHIDGPHKPTALEQLAISSNLITQLDELWGLTQWPEVNPKSIRDKVYLVLKKSGEPLHFSEIAKKIGEITTNPKKVTTQAVHNELIKDKRFVLIGRGIYALAEWGYQAGTVADIIESILKEESPLTKNEIIARVLAKRQVKTTTIILNLQEKPQFERIGKVTYKLKQS